MHEASLRTTDRINSCETTRSKQNDDRIKPDSICLHELAYFDDCVVFRPPCSSIWSCSISISESGASVWVRCGAEEEELPLELGPGSGLSWSEWLILGGGLKWWWCCCWYWCWLYWKYCWCWDLWWWFCSCWKSACGCWSSWLWAWGLYSLKARVILLHHGKVRTGCGNIFTDRQTDKHACMHRNTYTMVEDEILISDKFSEIPMTTS